MPGERLVAMNGMRRNVFVAGGTGFSGSRLVPLARGHAVRALARPGSEAKLLVAALVSAVESPVRGVQVVDVPAIRAAAARNA